MPLSNFAKDKIRSLHLSKHTKSIPNGAMPSNAHVLDDMAPVPITPRTADPLRGSFPRSRSPSPERRGASPNTKASSTAAGSIKSNTSRKEPRYEETALNISSSPPLTSFLNDRHSASSAQEEAWLRSAFRLRLSRLILAVMTLVVSVSALGVSSATLRAYHANKLSNSSNGGWHLHLWPIDIDLRPTLGQLIPAAIIALASVVYIAAALIPSPHSRTTQMTHLFTILTSLSLLLSFFATIFSQVLIHHTARDSILSFTCRLYRGAENFNQDMIDLGIPVIETGVGYPAGFKRVCMESEAAGGLMAAVLGLSVLSVGVVVWGAWRKGKVEKAREERWEGKWSA